MREPSGSNLILAAALAAVLAGIGGCGLVGVELTSTPDTVRYGDPVTFDIKLTNYSPCPLETTAAILVPFVSQAELDAEFAIELPPDAPPEILEFIQALRDFIDQLCAGGTPTIPTPPEIEDALVLPARPGMTAGCSRGDGKIECEFSMPVGDDANEMSFALLGGRLQCAVDDATVSCGFDLPLPGAATAGATTSAIVQQLTCLPIDEIPDVIGIGSDDGVLCFLGTFPMVEGLGPNEMATGQVTLPARGAGPVRNFVIVLSVDEEDAGVCKGGGDAGDACTGDGDCSGGSCAPGICVGGDTPGLGCDVDGDCPNGDCALCNVELPPTALPIDCTTTYVSPEGVPVASRWGLAALALLFLAGGTYWLQRRVRL